MEYRFSEVPMHSYGPSLVKIKELPSSKVFMISLYVGPSKPPSVHEYMKDVVEEFKRLSKEGLYFNEKHYSVPLPDAFICDAPARAFLKCIKGHSGYSSCERCVQPGVHLNGKIVYPDMVAALRTDAEFDEMLDEEHHRDMSPLRELGVGLVTSFVLDYMHLVCLGIVRKLVSLWVKGPLTCRISSSVLTVVSENLKRLRQNLPRNFSRKPQSLYEYSQWKATEFRQFLLYTGPVVLFNAFPKCVYKNFLVLSVAIRILLSPDLCSDYCDYAEKLLKFFVTNFAKIYGSEFLVYNTHSLTHLAQDARKYGALDSVSCFPYENYLGQLKRMVRRPQNPVEQIVRRVDEKQTFNRDSKGSSTLEEHLKQPHFSGPTPLGFSTYTQFKQCQYKGMTISCSPGNNCFEINSRVALVRNLLVSPMADIFAVCEFFNTGACFFDYPVASSSLGITVVSALTGQLFVVPVAQLSKKLVLLPMTDMYVALPQLHDY